MPGVNLPIITDPFFYLVAIPAVLLLGISKSGFGAGLGSLSVPLMALAVTVPQAAAILMPVLLLMDLMTVAALRKNFDRKLLSFILPLGLVGTVVGTFLFKVLDTRVVAGMVGVFTLLFLAQRMAFPLRPDSPPPPKWFGAILSIASGFTSFVAHAGGPPISIYVIPMRLAPLLFTGTLALYFFTINLAKWVPYAWLGLLDARNMATSLALLPFAPLGVFAGVRIARRIQPRLFYGLVYTGMLLTGCKLVWDGFLAG